MNRIRKQQQNGIGAVAPSGGRKLPRLLVGVLNGSFLTREKVLANMPFFLFVALMMVLYISYGYYTERTVRELHRTDGELKELRSEYITVRSHLDRTERQSQVAEDIQDIGLVESRVPPQKIEVGPEQLERRVENE
ncbi:MAG: hypothetical protein H6595_04290 [Flavobacteriales bacterium]|nr:hypothetical protein [Flavobacteriales bacterium]MCB9166679.1 hypothetical protein [Flavobacteriales bacterium]